MAKYASYILYLLIAIFVVILYVNGFGPLESAQRSLNDLLVSLTAPEAQSPHVILVPIDGKAQDEYGRWPWNQDRLADLAAAVAGGEPKVLVLDVDLYEDAAQDSAGHTDILAGQLTWMKNVVLPYDIALATYRSNLTSNPDFLFDNSVHVDNALGMMADRSSLLARKVFLPADKLLANRPYLGFDYEAPDDDGVLRRHPLLVNYEGFYYPSMALLAATRFLRVPADMVEVDEGQGIRLGDNHFVPMNEASQMRLTFSKTAGFKQISAATVLSDGFDRTQFKGKLVIVYPETFGRTETFTTPITAATSATIVKATAMSNIINGTFIIEKNNQAVVDMLILFAIGALCAFLLPRVNMTYRILLLGGGLFLLINANYFLVASFNTLAVTVYIALELILFMVASPILDSEIITGEKPKVKPKPIRPPRHVETAATVGKGAEANTRELLDRSSDAINVPTAALADSGRQSTAAVFGDHQTINLDGKGKDPQSAVRLAANPG